MREISLRPGSRSTIPKPPPRYFSGEGGTLTGVRQADARRRVAVRTPMRRADEEPRGLPQLATAVDDCANVVVCVAASGGVGLSVTAALLALTFAGRDLSCALVDADCGYGGLDVLLGLERDQGMRMSGVEAPLGRLEGDALAQELPSWGGVRVLGADPWNGESDRWWEVQAAVVALAQVHDVVVVDAGRGEQMGQIPALAGAPAVLVTEMTVLGLARARVLARRLRSSGGEARRECRVLGMQPRGAPRQCCRITAAQAQDYVGVPVAGVLEPRRALYGEVLDGLGVAAVPRGYRKVLGELADLIREADGRGHGTA
ncbi:hypothetical protein [Bifidobacterium moraviense]|nr:hypothetical protein [Bifidobacterium sp. DSM 109958]